jgi:L-aspartate oxidase
VNGDGGSGPGGDPAGGGHPGGAGYAGWRRDADVVVVGSGAAGISAALTAAAAGASVLVVTKDLTGGASPLAQGGLAAALGPGDTTSAHAADTVTAGAGLCDPDVVSVLAAGAPGAVDWLVRQGARLERRDLRLEGGHSQRRIVHSGDDATGAEVHRALLEALLTSRVQILDRCIALDLAGPESRARQDGGYFGPSFGTFLSRIPASGGLGLAAATIGPGGTLDPGVITARAVILAAGGLGQAFATTSNPAGATGDAMAIAARAGAVLRDPEFVQFHPTVLWREGATGQCPLVTEALRGAGAVLRDLSGAPVMAGHDPRGDLAPRDIVAARSHAVITASDGPGHVWLDATALGAGVLENGFPTVTAACRKYGVDPVTDYIPVAPGAHYSCGGIRADLDGRTSVAGLYAVGEAASTGVHGANRLASNSLIEAVIAGRRAGAAAATAAAAGTGTGTGTAAGTETAAATAAGAATTPGTGTGTGSAETTVLPQVNGTFLWPQGYERRSHPAGAAAESRAVLASAMSRYAGVLRDAGGLERLTAIIAESRRRDSGRATGHAIATGASAGASGAIARDASAETGQRGTRHPGTDLADVEAANLREVSALIAAAALHRAESRGCHRRSDASGTEPAGRHTLVRLDGGHIVVNLEES